MGSNNILGFDYGEKTIGVAVGNSASGQAHPLANVRVIRGQPEWEKISSLIDEWRPAALVVGLPLNMDGSENPVTPKARKFGNRLNGRYNLPVHMVDERLTTRDARTELYNAGVTERRHKPVLDKLAAQSILQTFLTEHKKQQPGSELESD
ncbi:MAG: Holliday junction resolvase RuvX [Acidiferrobacterales bacterium]|jgi:putative Holliday junction resolvase|nr:Holliday junction resolvase RuvX [Acidiferrobacterales bacterium]